MAKIRFKPKLNVLFAILGTLILIPNVSADFSVGDDKLNKINVTNGTYSLTFDYNDGNITNDYVFYSDDNKLTIKEIDLPKTKSHNLDNHKFIGWYSEKVGGSKISFPYTVNFTSNKNLKVYARYSNNNPYTSGGNLTASTNTYYIGSESSTISLSSNQSINLYYSSSSSGVYNKDNYGTLNVVPTISNAKTKAVLNSDIVLNGGTIQLNSTLGYKSGNGGYGNYLNSSISSNDYTALDLNGYTIIVNSGSINGYGIIYNSKDEGGIVMNGGTLISPFLINDFKGGGNTVFGYVNTVTPFFMHSMPFLGCEIVFSSNSSLKGEASLNASGDKYTTTIPLIGNSSSGSLISISSGYVIKRTTSFDRYSQFYPSSSNAGFTNLSYLIDSNSLYEEEVLFVDNPKNYISCIKQNYLPSSVSSANISITSIEMSLSFKKTVLGIPVNFDVTISMALCDFSIPSWMDLSIYNTYVNFASSMVALPGSKIYVDNKSTINFNNKSNSYSSSTKINSYARFTLLDDFPKDFYHLDKDKTAIVYGNAYVNNIATYNPAVAKIYGKLTFSSITATDINCYSLGGTFDYLSNEAISSLKNNSSIIDISSRFYFPHWNNNNGKYTPNPARYYSLPIIYKQDNSSTYKALFQMSFGTTINEGTYDNKLNVLTFNGNKYIRLLDKTFYSSLYETGDLATSSKRIPSQANYNGKMSNSVGTFVQISSVNETLGIIYVVCNNTKYIYVAGAYIPINSEITRVEKTDKNGNKTIVIGTTYAKPDNNIFTPKNDGDGSIKCATNLEYNYAKKEWIFSYAKEWKAI